MRSFFADAINFPMVIVAGGAGERLPPQRSSTARSSMAAVPDEFRPSARKPRTAQPDHGFALFVNTIYCATRQHSSLRPPPLND
jgi:hypothetical protein